MIMPGHGTSRRCSRRGGRVRVRWRGKAAAWRAQAQLGHRFGEEGAGRRGAHRSVAERVFPDFAKRA